MAAKYELAEEPLPIAQLGRGSEVVRRVAETGRPRVVTEDGVEVAVILDIAAYYEMQRGNGVSDLRRALLEASAEVDAGKVVDDEAVRADLHARFVGRVPPELLEELDRE
ncbi:MAG: type II toxin-antitoxin system prevent-host-death family antitoxin [Chloroflexi bacterium]|nr:type II toxin-antitoxin system prevent-host-death family antitoxin [Chloroflexota bacterium]